MSLFLGWDGCKVLMLFMIFGYYVLYVVNERYISKNMLL